jgi:hypothetical protein
MPKPPRYIDEHIQIRKGWGQYVRVVTELRRAEANRTSEFVTALRARMLRSRQPRPTRP